MRKLRRLFPLPVAPSFQLSFSPSPRPSVPLSPRPSVLSHLLTFPLSHLTPPPLAFSYSPTATPFDTYAIMYPREDPAVGGTTTIPARTS